MIDAVPDCVTELLGVLEGVWVTLTVTVDVIETVLESDEDAFGVLDELAELPKEAENETDAVLDLEAVILAV